MLGNGLWVGRNRGVSNLTPQLSLMVQNADATKVLLTLDKEFDATLPDKSAFGLSGKTISGIALDGTKKILTLTVTAAYLYGENPVLIYDKPASNPLKSGTTEFDSFTKEVTNTINAIASYAALYNARTNKPVAGIAATQNSFLNDLVVGGVLADLDSFRLLMADLNTASEALLDIKDPTKVATLHGTTAPVFTAGLGFQMLTSASRYIDLLWKPSDGVNYALHNCSIILYTDTNSQESTKDVGTYDGTNYDQILLRDSFDTSAYTVHHSTPITGCTNSSGLWVIQITDSTHLEIYRNGSQITGSPFAVTAAVALSTLSFFLGGRHIAAGADNYAGRRYGLVGFGKALTSTKVTALYNAFTSYMTYGKNGNIFPAFIQTDFSDSNLATLRTTIKGRIWPGGYPATGKDSISVGVASPLATDSANLASVDQLSFTIAGIAARTPYVWHPTVSNGKFVIYHCGHMVGHTGTGWWEDLGDATVIRGLIDLGFTVCGINMPPSNDGTEGMAHSYPTVAAPYQTVVDLHYFLDTSIRVLNEYAGQFTAFYMTGFSGGGWTTTMMAAIDDRLTKSAPTAGSLPILATNHAGSTRDWEQHLPGLDDLIEYGDLYVMATTGGRYERQYLNAHDSVFDINMYQYAPFVDEMAAITNRFKLTWDAITTTHEVTANTASKIIAFFAT